jgi:N-acetylglutamate synthase-like GNAT family acetyltransferase
MSPAVPSTRASTPAIRPATVADVPALVALINRAFAIERLFVDGDRTDVAEVERLLGEGGFLIAEDRHMLLGCVHVEQRADRGYFGLLAIEPAAQRRGIGRALIAAAEGDCRDRGATAMDLRIVNLRAELPPFYRALGYREVATEPFPDPANTLKQPCHFIRMSKPLTPRSPA